MKKRLLPLAALLLIFRMADGQSCKYLPADCPENGVEGYGTGDDSISRLSNPVLPQEITMENRLRRWTAGVMNRVAEKHHWQAYQLSELASSGFSTPQGVIIAYPLRPPHWYYVTWEFIVNDDSLQAWRSWLQDYSQQRLNALNQNAASQSAAYDRAKPYRDSADHYSQLMGQYLQDHMAQYQKDLVAGNKSGISSYEKGLAGYQKKIDYFTKKASDIQNDPGAEASAADADALMRRQTIRFRDASLLIVEFGFNMDYAKTAGELMATDGMRPPTAAGSAAALWFRNSEPEMGSIDLFSRSPTNVLLLEGDWNRKADRYDGYRPNFESDKASIDVTTEKKIKCDRVQTIDCHLSGNPEAIRQFLADVPGREITALVTRN